MAQQMTRMEMDCNLKTLANFQVCPEEITKN